MNPTDNPAQPDQGQNIPGGAPQGQPAAAMGPDAGNPYPPQNQPPAAQPTIPQPMAQPTTQQPLMQQPPMPQPVQQMPGSMPVSQPAAGMPEQPANGQQVVPVAVNKSNPNSTQNTLQIAEIRDGIVIMNDGSFRSVVMVKSINFDLMSPQEQEAVEYSYQGFLNSLYFPIQIFVRSQRVDLQPYIEKLDKIRTEHDNMLLALLMEDYIGYIDALSQQTNIMDKKFYVVVPYFPHDDIKHALTDQSKNFFAGLGAMFSSQEQHVTINEADLEAAKTELRNRVQALLAGLMQCGVQGIPLDTQELIELYYDTYNPDTATRQQLKNFDDLTADVVTKGQGAAAQSHLQGGLQ